MHLYIEEKQVHFAHSEHFIQLVNVLMKIIHLLIIIEYLSPIIIQNVLFYWEKMVILHILNISSSQ